LFSWLYSKNADGTYSVNESIGGNVTASDADIDIALSLIFASKRWNDPSYSDAAKGIIGDIWKNEVIIINNKPYLLSNNIEKNLNKDDLIVNPSYFAPYAFKIFKQYDPQDDWNALVDNSYTVLNNSMNMQLDKNSTVNLPPNWIIINRKTAAIGLPP